MVPGERGDVARSEPPGAPPLQHLQEEGVPGREQRLAEDLHEVARGRRRGVRGAVGVGLRVQQETEALEVGQVAAGGGDLRNLGRLQKEQETLRIAWPYIVKYETSPYISFLTIEDPSGPSPH